MKRTIRNAAVLGAGTMGSRIAAHLANAGVDCLLLDLPGEGGGRNAVVEKALKNLTKSRPPAYFSAAAAKRIRPGNFEDDLERIAGCDWVIEAVVEKLDVKRSLLEKVDQFRKPGSVVSSNTSGLPIAQLAEGRSDDFRRHWLGTHFFNPPRHMRLLELIPAPETDAEVSASIADFCDRRLGKVVVRANDRPNFIANRIFLFSVMHALQTMMAQGLTVEEVDALTGPLIGRPRMATFRLADFTGVDVCVYVAGNLYNLVPDDEKRAVYDPPDFLKKMVEKGLVGDKAGQGFYKKDPQAPGGRLVLDLETLEYREMKQPSWASADEARTMLDVADRIRAMIEADDAAGRFLWETLSELFLYAAARIPEVCDDIVSIDTTMKAGFNWERGIFEIWNSLGLVPTVERMRADGRTIPPLVEKALASESKAFYSDHTGKPSYFEHHSATLQPIPAPPGVLRLDDVKRGTSAVRSNPGASVWDLGDGAALLEFHSKANSLDQDVLDMIGEALDETEANFEALVIGNEGQHFSVGANLKMMLGLIAGQRWDVLEQKVVEVQSLTRRIRASAKPVVGAVFGRVLGGGCEIALYCDRLQAAAETYIGLAEVGVGLIPAGGGCAEMIRRHTADRSPKDDLSRPSRFVFETIGGAKVAGSAIEAREWRMLGAADGITMNRDRLLAEAKKAALALAAGGYEPPEEEKILVGGKGTKASLELTVWMMREAAFLSKYDTVIGGKLAHVLAGGDLTEPSYVSLDYMLGLEREAFLSLAGEEKTRQRIEHLLQTGQPLRN